MLISLGELDDAYRTIRKTVLQNSGQCQVLVVSLSEVDSLCATKILLHVLKSDFIQYLLIPISNCLELGKIGEVYLSQTEARDSQYNIRYLILVNCGAMLDLSQCLPAHQELVIYVFDSHRPVHLSNVFSDDHIQVLDDGNLNFLAQELWPAFSAIELGENVDHVDQENKDLNEGEEELDLSGSEYQKRNGDLEKYREQLLQYYRRSNWTGSATSIFIYALAGQLQKTDSDLLWYCIVGSAACFMLNNGSEDKYPSDIELLGSEVNRMFGSGDYNSSSSSSSSDSSSSVITRKAVIREGEELRFLLLHHWSLYQSMLHSPYVSSIMQPWTEKGKKRLESFLAKMGISLKQSTQSFTFMDSQIKRRIFEQLGKYGPEEGLNDLFFPTFVRRYGYKLRVSASDTVYAINAILSHPSTISSSNSLPEQSSHSSATKNNFHVAFDALDAQNVQLLSFGIHLAKLHWQRIVKTASYMFNIKLIKNMKRFRLGVLTQPSRGSNRLEHGGSMERSGGTFSIDQELILSSYHEEEPWATALSMRSLANFVWDSQKSKLPLVLASLSISKRKYNVIGCAIARQDTQDSNVPIFLEAFRRTAEQLQVSTHYDGYGCIFLYIDQDELSGFVQTLQSTMTTYN